PGPPGTGRSRWRRAARRFRPAGAVAAVLVVAAAVLAPAAADAVITRSETRDARDFEPEPVAERPGDRQWAWQPPADVVDVVPVRHGVAVATRDGAVTALHGDDGRVEWRYARPGAPVGVLLASADRRTVVVSYRSPHDTRAQQVVVLDADTGTPRFDVVVRSVLVETGQLMPGERVLALRDGEVVTGYDVLTGEARWRWSPPAGCASWFGQVVWGRTTVLVPVECADTLGVTALDEATGRERWRHELPRAESDGERQDVLLRGTRDGSAAFLQVFGARPDPDAAPDGLLDTDTGRVLARPARPWTVRTDLGVIPLLELEQAGGPSTDLRALDPATGATTPLSVDACPARTADLTTRTAYVRACADNGRELTLVTQSLDGSPPTSTPVRLDGSGSPARSDVLLLAVPGAIVVARTAFGGTPAPVVGLTA
ncbi:PQQ-binding-like beta-propeller repeat protein, partial [Actinosynnema sp. NPDC059335]|uniref:outer membrane protein assembly factor BamB family protein n=1 Tax=Actinosynnema sp. NPDC059335 TaxID=3346804 RepID=UPI00366D759D